MIIHFFTKQTLGFLILGGWNLISSGVSFYQKSQSLSAIEGLLIDPQADQSYLSQLFSLSNIQNKLTFINLILAVCLFILGLVKAIKKSQKPSLLKNLVSHLFPTLN